jgi:hypothetical protein
VPRRPAIIPNYELKLCIQQDLFAKLTLELWSDLEGRVPLGAYKAFFEARLREWFAQSRLDVAEVVPGTQPGKHFVSASAETLDILRRHYANP